MKKYELIEQTAEFKDKRAIKPGGTVDIALSTPGYDEDPEILQSFDSLDEAREALKNYESDVRVLSGHDGKRYYLVTWSRKTTMTMKASGAVAVMIGHSKKCRI